MPQLHDILVEADLPYFNFLHLDKEYVIHLSLMVDETDKAYQLNLSPVILRNATYVPGLNVAAANATESYVSSQGGVEQMINTVFLKRVNDYLALQGGEPTTFPEDAEQFQQFVYLLKNGFNYANGQIVLTA